VQIVIRFFIMKISSSRRKGKRVEGLIRDIVKEACSLSDEDIRIPVGAENGGDLKLSNRGKARFPFSAEIKARKKMDTLYKFMEQASKHYPELVPIVILKGDYKEPLVLISLDHFLSFVGQR